MMISCEKARKFKREGKISCAVSRKGVENGLSI